MNTRSSKAAIAGSTIAGSEFIQKSISSIATGREDGGGVPRLSAIVLPNSQIKCV
ncbi:hypothetical protein H6F89_30455 [Cyanobacteria bacterium FACHB-63]|nr:hypothetical protein [Cyanobacteria bacterium FACHB-63]